MSAASTWPSSSPCPRRGESCPAPPLTWSAMPSTSRHQPATTAGRFIVLAAYPWLSVHVTPPPSLPPDGTSSLRNVIDGRHRAPHRQGRHPAPRETESRLPDRHTAWPRGHPQLTIRQLGVTVHQEIPRRASNERHFSVKISPVTPTTHIMHIDKPAGQAAFAMGSRIATHSTWCVIGKRSKTRKVRTL